MQNTRKKPAFRSVFASASGGFMATTSASSARWPYDSDQVMIKPSSDAAPPSAEGRSSR